MVRVLDILKALRKESADARIFLVGGAVRDQFIPGRIPKDFDYEVFGVELDVLEKVLGGFGPVAIQGKSFGIFVLDGLEFAVPRKERKVALGHTGFEVQCDPYMSVEEAASRRDFTINAIYQDVETGEVIDPFEGIGDIRRRWLAPVNAVTFKEDALRIFRAARFASQLGFSLDEEVYKMAEKMLYDSDNLSKERIWEEWKKMLLGPNAMLGVEALMDSVFGLHYPEVIQLHEVVQDPKHHPEGDAFAHTMFVVGAASRLIHSQSYLGHDKIFEDRALAIMLAALLHDIGKVSTTQIQEDGKIISRGHDVVSAEMAPAFMKRIGVPDKIRAMVVPLVREHMFIAHVKGSPSKKSVRRLALKLHPASIYDLEVIFEADIMGRPGLSAPYWRVDAINEIGKMADEMNVVHNKPEPIVLGRHLIEWFDVAPGPEMGKILKGAFEAQMDGMFDHIDGGYEYMKEMMNT